jgi:hypothetical protein
MVRFSKPGNRHATEYIMQAIEMMRLGRSGIRVTSAGFVLAMTGCGSGAKFSPPPIELSVSLSETTIVVPSNGMLVSVPVTVVAPTETVTLTVGGLPTGVAETYKESESNPSGLLSLSANSSTMPGTYMPTITVASTGQFASLVFTLVVSSPPKPAGIKHMTRIISAVPHHNRASRV